MLFDPFGATWHEVREGAIAVEGEGFDGVWLYDHLAGSVHGRSRVLGSWTTLTAVATVVPRIAIGPMVLNVANRPAGTLGVMAATLQEVSEGRLLLGLGAGGGRTTPYAAEQMAFDRPVPGDIARRSAIESTVTTLRAVWSGSVGGVAGFLQPDPAPSHHCRRLRSQGGRSGGGVADGINLPMGHASPRFSRWPARLALHRDGTHRPLSSPSPRTFARRRSERARPRYGIDSHVSAVHVVATPFAENARRLPTPAP